MSSSQWFIFILLLNLFSGWLQWRDKSYFLATFNAFAACLSVGALIYLALKEVAK